jgi:hypothetical protein
MESEQLDPHDAQRIAERAEAAPYVDYPATPWWYAPAVGLWVAGLLLTLDAMRDHTAVALPAMLVLIGLECAYLGWYTRRHGALPSLRRPPAEFRGALAGYAVGTVLAVAAITTAWLVAGGPAAAVVALVLVTGGIALYERSYARAAARTRARLA